VLACEIRGSRGGGGGGDDDDDDDDDGLGSVEVWAQADTNVCQERTVPIFMLCASLRFSSHACYMLCSSQQRL
jgi:hypothetical protein